MLVSIIVPVHNAELYLERCLCSLLAQTYTNIEIIIVNDGSSDRSKIIIEKYAKQDSRINVFTHETNLGEFYARKTGVEAVKGKYHIACDADDELLRDFVEKGVCVLKKQEVDILEFGRFKVKGAGASFSVKRSCSRFKFPNNHLIQGRDIFDSFFLEEKIKPSMCGKFFKTEFAKQNFPLICPNSAANDLLIMSCLTFHAQSYLYIRDCGYIYHYGCGHWGKTLLTESQMQRMAQTSLLLNQLRSFFEEKQMEKVYFEKLELKRKEILKNILYMAHQECLVDPSQKFIRMLLSTWGDACFVEILYESLGKELHEIKNSIPWRITYPIRALYDFIFLTIFKYP